MNLIEQAMTAHWGEKCDEYDAYTSEERFKDICDINNWRFNANGYLIEQE